MSPTKGDVDVSFTAYGITQSAAFSITGLSIAEAADNLESMLNEFSNVRVDVTHSGPNVAGGDSIFVFGHIFVTFLSNTGSLPLLDVTPRQVNGEAGGLNVTVSRIEEGNLVAEQQKITMTASSTITSGTFIVVATYARAGTAEPSITIVRC